MKDQPRYEPYEATEFFEDGRASRPLVDGVVPYGSWKEDSIFETGKQNGKPVEEFPFKVTREVLDRGRERYNIYCTVCHDAIGSGKGMVIQRGFRPVPPSLHIDRLRNAPAGYFFDVMTNGFGAMSDYRAQISPYDRWAITAYIRALQLSQNTKLADLPEAAQKQLMDPRLKHSGMTEDK